MELKTNPETTHAIDPVLRQAMNNDGEALEELFSRDRGRLYKTALRLLGNSEDAEDALQDGLLLAFRHLRGFKGASQFSTWLTRIVINVALMQLRRGRPAGLTSIDQRLDPDDQPLANTLPAPGPNPEEMYARQEQLQLLEQTLQTMPMAYRQAVWLCHVQGLKIREAAEAMGLRTGTVKSRLRRARRRLSEEVAEARPWRGVIRSKRIWRS